MHVVLLWFPLSIVAMGVTLLLDYALNAVAENLEQTAHKRTEFTLACDAIGGKVARMGDNNEITAFCIKDGHIEGVLQ